MSQNFVVVHEAAEDFVTATELADRILVEKIDWLDEDQIEYQRNWLGEHEPGSRLTWKTIPARAKDIGVPPVRGHFDGKPGEPDARAGRRAILYVLRKFERVDAIVLVRDVADQPERRAGLEQARANGFPCPILIGVANIERESWVLSGFDPVDEDEQARVDQERQNLGFDPRMRPHELTAAKNDQAKRSPKRVLSVLSDNNRDRERDCWLKTPLDRLKERGADNGLKDYLAEVETKLAPLISGHHPRAE